MTDKATDKAFSIRDPKINPNKPQSASAPALKPDNTPDDNDRVEIGPTQLAYDEWQQAGLSCPDLQAMRKYRLNRIVACLNQRGYDGVLLFDPLSIRYATDSTNMQLWNCHNPFRACMILADGYMILWDYGRMEYFSQFNPLIQERRSGASFFYFATGSRTEEKAQIFARQIKDVLAERAGGGNRIAVDKIQLAGYHALIQEKLTIEDGEELMEHARSVKGADEIRAMRCAIYACERSMDEMRLAVRPGVSENDVWAELQKANIRRGGEWIETRLLASGPRTNPWMHECGPRILANNDILAFDTDMVGCYGMCTDISRTWMVGDGKASGRQRDLYQLAQEHIETNAQIVAPGVSFRDLTLKGHQLPEEYVQLRYGVRFHGVGLCDEWPSIKYAVDLEECGYDGVLEPGMMLCVEAYIGKVGDYDGVKLENQLLVTHTGFENLTHYPYEQALRA